MLLRFNDFIENFTLESHRLLLHIYRCYLAKFLMLADGNLSE